MIICPNCGFENQNGQNWCKQCRKSLRFFPGKKAERPDPVEVELPGGTSEKTVSSGRDEPTGDLICCPSCGKENAPGKSWCSYCRKSLRFSGTGKPTADAARQDPEPEKTPEAPPVEEPVVKPETTEKYSGAGTTAAVTIAEKKAGKTVNPVKEARKPVRRISAARELLLLIQEGFMILIGEPRNLWISLLFPLAAAMVTVWIAGENMFVNFESTKSACFILVCAAIWGGLFNSIQTVVKERKNVKRDYVSGALRIECFILSRAMIQLALCAIQSAVLCLSFYGIQGIYGNDLPAEGLILGSPMPEYYVTVLLVMYASDMLGLMISCIVKSEQLASQMSPYILIVQLLFSGVLFEMKGAASSMSAFMISRWGMEALGSISDLNGLPLRIQEEFPMIPHEADAAFTYTAEHLTEVWLIMLLFVIVPLVIGMISLYQVKNDKRD